ncbi:MAG TPA: COX15/CtaA family protein [Solirubrobacteraceae bacterium]|nr:COX15/CtaA family protein [Solirubrobacteraceae bacterium]
MSARLERLRARTNGYTVTPRQYSHAAYAALAALTLIVLSGAAVRLTGSGLGCPDWPRCYGHAYPPLNTHAVIEFSNRLITVPVSIAAGAAWLLALRRRPYRRDLMWLGALLPLGVISQAVLGGFTVRGELDYGWVMGHFALSMLILLAAAVLAWRAGHESALLEIQAEEARRHRAEIAADPAPAAANGSLAAANGAAPAEPTPPDRALIRSIRGLVALGALTIFAGTAATAAGPHAGGSPGQRINRLDFDGRGTMDFVIHRHGEIALAFGLAALAVWWLARRRDARSQVRRPLTALCVLLALQGVVGLDQYKTHLPTQLVWVHVGLACAAWLAAVWAACAAGALVPRRSAIAPKRPLDAPIAAPRPVKFPGN